MPSPPSVQSLSRSFASLVCLLAELPVKVREFTSRPRGGSVTSSHPSQRYSHHHSISNRTISREQRKRFAHEFEAVNEML